MSTLNWVKQVIGQDLTGDWLTKVSSDGTKFLAAQYNGGYVYLSTGNGIWEKANIAGGVSLYVESCAISGNGQYMLVGEYTQHIGLDVYGGRLYLSVNGGTTWTEIRPVEDENLAWYSVAINYSGQYMLAGEWLHDNLYFSDDFGVTWTLINEGTGYCDAACINDSGSVLVALGWGGTLMSVDYGATWTATLSDTSPEYPRGASCTALGDIIYLSCHPGYYTLRSSDHGATWTELTPNNESFYSTCSDDDSIVLIADQVEGLKSSTDKVNWTIELPTMLDVSSNGSGTRIICGQINGYVYISYVSDGFKFFSNHIVLRIGTAGYWKVLGYRWFDNVRIWRYTDPGVTPNAINIDNPTPNAIIGDPTPTAINIDNATLVSADIAADVLAKTAEYYGLRYQQNVTLFPDVAIKPGDIRTLSSLYGKFVDGITEKLESDLTSGYLIAAEFVGRERMAS